jgi:hypothetical protein
MAAQLTNDETIALLNAKAKESGDEFVVKIFRRPHLGAIPQAVATVSGARMEHIGNLETWVPMLCGGGPLFFMRVCHVTDTSTAIGDYLQLSVPMENNPAKYPTVETMKSSNWRGPTKLDYPVAAEPNVNTSAYSVLSPPPGGNVAVPPITVPGPAGAGAFASEAFAQVNALREQLERQREQLLAAQREMENERRKMEMDTVRREADERMRAFEAKLAANTAPREPQASALEKILPAVMPLVQAIMQGQNENRQMMMKMDADRAAQQQAMIVAMMQKPAVDPMIMALIERNKPQSDSDMVHSMSEAMHSMSKTTLDLVRTAADLNIGSAPKDHPALLAIKEGVKALNALMTGYAASVQDKQNPQSRPAPKPLPGFQQQALASPPQPMQPQSVQPQPMPQAAEPPAGDTVDQLVAAIKAHHNVVELAGAFIKAVKDNEPVLSKAMEEYDGDFKQLFGMKVGGWAMADPANAAYLKTLLDEVNKQAEAAGMLESEEVDEAGTAEGEEEDASLDA